MAVSLDAIGGFVVPRASSCMLVWYASGLSLVKPFQPPSSKSCTRTRVICSAVHTRLSGGTPTWQDCDPSDRGPMISLSLTMSYAKGTVMYKEFECDGEIEVVTVTTKSAAFTEHFLQRGYRIREPSVAQMPIQPLPVTAWHHVAEKNNMVAVSADGLVLHAVEGRVRGGVLGGEGGVGGGGGGVEEGEVFGEGGGGRGWVGDVVGGGDVGFMVRGGEVAVEEA
ncbi:hypothetical protein FH972_022031 [Carpinus fangiana]|uniref:Uncharacterized protein n=1 Tax=Carpinus fangiana TaxID=176857 RepID=A0A5N6KR25_9ROSI|nr:hypothetical protein FH972_022031 [Carpinus fangiana]